MLIEKLIGEENTGKNSTIRYADVIDALRNYGDKMLIMALVLRKRRRAGSHIKIQRVSK